MRRLLPRLLCTCLLASAGTLTVPATAAAQEQLAAVRPAAAALTNGILFPVSPLAASTLPVPQAPARRDFDKRPSLLPALYVSTVVLEALDAHSTLTALGKGGREANPLMQGVVQHRGALLAVKAGVAGSTIFLAEKMWKRNRVGAVVMLAIVNGVNAAVVAHNYKVGARLR